MCRCRLCNCYHGANKRGRTGQRLAPRRGPRCGTGSWDQKWAFVPGSEPMRRTSGSLDILVGEKKSLKDQVCDVRWPEDKRYQRMSS